MAYIKRGMHRELVRLVPRTSHKKDGLTCPEPMQSTARFSYATLRIHLCNSLTTWNEVKQSSTTGGHIERGTDWRTVQLRVMHAAALISPILPANTPCISR